MADSFKPGPLGSDCRFDRLPARTPGVLGYLDQADPSVTSLLGDTPGPLGMNDYASPDLARSDALFTPHCGAVCREADGSAVILGTQEFPAASRLFNEVMTTELSGSKWVACFPASVDTEDLVDPFKTKVRQFLSALTAAGCSYYIANTLRPKERAYLMHYAAAIARKEIAAKDVPPMAGVRINWVHPTQKASISAAVAMAKAFKIVYPPALDSNHTRGLAIDIRIDGAVGKSVANAAGDLVKISKHGKTESDLFAVGASYGVIKLIPDEPHWSYDGK